MSTRPTGGFLRGLTAGLAGGLAAGAVVLYVLSMSDVLAVSVLWMPKAQEMLGWTYRNLGLSVVPFLITAALYARSLRTLARCLGEHRPVEQVAQAEQLADVWTGLFFGIGVVWTAVGMRNALVFALGEPGSVVRDGGFAVLERMVDGGILLALSTTIVGAVGGYVMRIVKAVWVGAELKRYYREAGERQGLEIQKTLGRIEHQLQLIVRRTPGEGAGL